MVKKKKIFVITDPIIIDSVTIEVGQEETVKIIVGRTPSDNQITITTHVYRSKNPGPTILILGGVHGDEINGIEIVNQMIFDKEFENLEFGTVIAIPLLNVFGFNNFSRDVPDGKDVNRSFPGSSSGSLASRVANTITKKILPYVDYAVDCHTGGSSRYNHPQIRVAKIEEKAMEMAKAFGAPYTIISATIPNSFRRITKERGIPTVVYEAGESIRLCGLSIQKGKEGIRRVLEYLGYKIGDPSQETPSTTLIPKSTWIRATQAGIFTWSKSSGHYVQKGEPIGTIKNPYGTKHITVFSKHDGHIIGHNNASVVNQGDALFHIGLVQKIHEGF